MYQSGRAGDEAKKRKSPAKSGRVGIYAILDKRKAPPSHQLRGLSLETSLMCLERQESCFIKGQVS